ncbi:hypothetical protein NDU88_001621 [Pleurodeles waltl]|uniref:Uncharacterized protein n=1 Tax=Pleurodeles waltl TaxID=8319 RepID=A0AAV7VXC2_PLEWA|nr:hypothetical protein NDU88_001621 [Pleurodeles waltl]
MHNAKPTRLPFPGRGDGLLRLRVPLLALLAHRTKLLALQEAVGSSRSLRARASRCQGEETRCYGCTYSFSRTSRAGRGCWLHAHSCNEEPLKDSREVRKNNRDLKNNLVKQILNRILPAPDTKIALYSSSASHQECKFAETSLRQGAAFRLHLLQVQAPPGLHHSNSPIQNLQARNLRSADLDQE